jgi:hypothetical protein
MNDKGVVMPLIFSLQARFPWLPNVAARLRPVRLMLRLGTVIDEDPDEPGVLRVRLALRPRWARGSRSPVLPSTERTGFNAPWSAGLEVQERSCRAAGVAR